MASLHQKPEAINKEKFLLVTQGLNPNPAYQNKHSGHSAMAGRELN